MKDWIHPKYNKNVAVECLCGNTFTIASTMVWPIKVEQCPACHPAYNKGKIIEVKKSQGRLQAYEEKLKRMAAAKK